MRARDSNPPPPPPPPSRSPQRGRRDRGDRRGSGLRVRRGGSPRQTLPPPIRRPSLSPAVAHSLSLFLAASVALLFRLPLLAPSVAHFIPPLLTSSVALSLSIPPSVCRPLPRSIPRSLAPYLPLSHPLPPSVALPPFTPSLPLRRVYTALLPNHTHAHTDASPGAARPPHGAEPSAPSGPPQLSRRSLPAAVFSPRPCRRLRRRT